jgi:methylmalonyl-CoA mutase
MHASDLDLHDAFAPVTAEQWRARVDRDLRGASFDKRLVTRLLEDFDIPPLYAGGQTPDAGVPGAAPFTRGARPASAVPTVWDVRQLFANPDPRATAAEIAADRAAGVSSVHLVVDAGGRGAGVVVDGVEALAMALGDAVDGRVSLDAGADACRVAWMAQAVGVQAGDLGIDPVGTRAAAGGSVASLREALVDAALVAAEVGTPALRPACADSRPWHRAGASEDLDLAVLLSSGVAWLRAFEDVGVDPEDAAPLVGFRVAVGCDFLLGIAKLRALRALWGHALAACGVTAGPAHVHAFPAERLLTRRDPWVNILRVTATTFAAAVGGADAVTALPWDHRLGLPDADSRRLARNTQLVLALESHLGHAVDPAGGSYAIEAWTDALSERAWRRFQTLDAKGGIASVAGDTWVREELAAQRTARARATATRETEQVGVSAFPNLAEAVPARPTAPTPATRPGDAPLAPAWVSGPWEDLRDRADAAVTRPTAFLATLGPLAEHTGRATWTANLLQAGGLATVDPGPLAEADAAGTAFRQSGARVAVLCGADTRYATLAEDATRALRAAGAARVLLAGRPGDAEDALRAAGVDDFVFLGADVLAIVTALVDAAEVSA